MRIIFAQSFISAAFIFTGFVPVALAAGKLKNAIPTCTAEALGKVVALEDSLIGVKLLSTGKFSLLGEHEPSCRPIGDVHCDIQNCIGRINPPMSVSAIRNGVMSRVEVDTLVSPFCEMGYRLCPHSGDCGEQSFFVTEMHGKHWSRVDKPARIEDVSNQEWQELEADLDSKIKGGFVRGPYDEGKPGVPQAGVLYREVRSLNFSATVKLKVAVLSKAEKNNPGNGPVFGFWIIGLAPHKRTAIFAESARASTSGHPDFETLAIQDGERMLVKIKGPTNFFLYSLGHDGAVIDQIAIDHFHDQCD